MPERLALITELLQDTREAQEKGNAMLGDLRVDMAALQRSHEGQGQSIADLRADVRSMMARQQATELQMQRLPHHEAQIAAFDRRLEGHESRLRALEGDGRETRVITGAAKGLAGQVSRYVVGAICGLLMAAAGAIWAVKNGGVPLQ